MFKYVLLIIAGMAFSWLANWSLKREENDDFISNAKYWLMLLVGIIMILSGIVYLADYFFDLF